MSLLEGIRRDLIDLGLERRAPEVPTLKAYLASKANGAEEQPPPIFRMRKTPSPLHKPSPSPRTAEVARRLTN
jgi:hypothetical protein